jgi:hypothetical protein
MSERTPAFDRHRNDIYSHNRRGPLQISKAGHRRRKRASIHRHASRFVLMVVGKRLYTLGFTKTTNLILCAGILPEAAAVSGRYRSLRLVASLVTGTLSNRKRFFLQIITDHVFAIHRGTLAL